MTNEKRIEKILTPEFVEKNAEIDNIDSFYDKVREIDSSITKTELEDYLKSVSDVMHKQELSSDDLENVSGGIGLLAVAAGITAVAGVFGATYGVGTAIGKFVYNIKHW